MKTLVCILAIVSCTATARAGLDATPELCERLYGEVKYTGAEGGGVQRGYQPKFEGFGGAIILAEFTDGKVDSIRYEIKGQTEFTPDQFALLASISALQLKKKFVPVGITADKKFRLWATEDNTAYLAIHSGEAVVDFMTQAKAINLIKQLPDKPAASADVSKPKREPEAKVPATTLKSPEPIQFSEVKLAHGITLEIPASWRRLGSGLNNAVKGIVKKQANALGFDTEGDQETILLAATAMSSPSTSVRVKFITPPLATPDEVRHISPDELRTYGEMMHTNMAKMAKMNGSSILEFRGCSLATVGESPSVLTQYKRTGPRGNVLVWQHQITRRDGEVDLSLSYLESEADLWAPVVERIEKSVKFVE